MNDQVKDGMDIQTTATESGKVIGVVMSLVGGKAFAAAPDGSERPLNAGDKIFVGEKLRFDSDAKIVVSDADPSSETQTLDAAQAVISFADGSVRMVTPQDDQPLTSESAQLLAVADLSEDGNPDFGELLAALESGEDISELLEETAAGEGGANGDESGQGVRFERVDQSASPTAGIDPDLAFNSPEADQNFVQQEVGNPEGVITLGTVSTDESKSLIYSASVDNPPEDTDLVITLSNGVEIIIPVGATTGTSAPQPAQGDDVYQDGESFNVGIASTSGGNYEALDTSSTATVTINDTVDTTTVTLDDVTVNEDQTITYTASVDNAPQGAFSVTLDNGVVINFADGALTGSSAPQAAQGDDVYQDGESFNVGIASTSGGNYEALDTSSTATVTINDTVDTTTVTLDDVTVNEDQTITYTASVDNAPQGAFSVTLDNGVVINFADGALTGSSAPQAAQGDDVYQDGESFNVGIASTSGGNYEALDTSSTATVTINDTVDTTTVTLDDVTVNEDQTITYTASVDNAPQGAFSVTLDNGVVINFADGALTGSSAPQAAQGDDVYQDGESFNVGIASTSGGNYEALDTTSTATITINDTVDTTTVTLDDVTVNEDQTITYTASVDNAPQGAFSVTLDNGVVINFADGALTGSSAPQAAQGDDVYQDGESFSVGIASTSGGNYEALDTSSTATVTINDTVDTTTVTLDDVTVNEDQTITYTASVDNAPQGAFSVTLDNGVVINFADGALTGSSAPQAAQGDDVYQDGESFNVGIASTSGGNYEALDTSSTATVTINDTVDTTTVTLDDVTVNEDQTITYTASVDNAPQGAFSVTLDNGVVINFADGALTGSSAPQAAQGDDVYQDGESFNVGIASTSGGNYEALDTSSTATVTINDTVDTTTVTLDDVTVNEDQTITYTASVDNAPQGAFSVTLDNGVVINFADGALTGSSAPQAAQGDDAYVDGDSFNVSIASTSGGNYEALDTSSTATVTISDTVDTTTVTLDDVTVNEDQTITYTASVDNAPQGAFSVTLDNGVVINFADGALTGSSAPQAAQGDDVYQDGESFNVGIASTSGGNYEALDTSSTATVTINDTVDTTTVTLDDVTVNEDQTITYTASVDNAPQGAFSVTLDNGVVINFADGALTGSSAPQAAQGDDVYQDGESFNVGIASTSGGNYEALDTSSTATVTINDTVDTTTVTLDDVTVNEDQTITYTASVDNAPQGAFSVTLDNGVVINFADGALTGSSAPQAAQGDDVYQDGESFNVGIASTSGGNYEALDTSSTATVTINDTVDTTTVTLDDVTVNEDQTITYTASVDNAPQGAFSVTLDNGVVINFADGALTGSSAPQAAQGDDAYVDGDSFNVSIASTSGGNYEALDTSSTATVTISDTVDTTTVTLDDVTVNEDQTITYTASVDNAPQGAFSVTLDNGVVINFADGALTGSSAPQAAQGDDVYQDGESFNVGIASTSGGNYEALDTSSTATVTINDTVDTTTVTLDDVTVNEDQTITYTASVDNAPQGAFSVTLDNGVVINFADGALTGSSAPQAAQGDDVYQDGESFNVGIASTSGGNYEALDTSSTATVTINDTVDTTTVTLDDVTVNEDQTITYTASVDNAPQGAFSVTLDNGVVINFADGALTGSSAPQAAQGDDAYVDGDSFNVSIASTSGGNYEALDTSSTATVTISDTVDTTTVTLDDVTVNEDQTITYTASVDNAPQGAFSVTLDNGVVINFADGALTGSSAPQAAQGDDVYQDGESFNVGIASTSGGNYEALDTSSTATVTINDTVDTTTVTLDDVTVNEDQTITYTASVDNAPQGAFSVTLDNGVVINFADGALTGSSAPQAAQGDDVYQDGESFNVGIASTSGGNYEALDTSSTATVTINDTVDTTTVTLDDVTVNEDQTITYTASVDNAPQGAFSVTLDNGVVINFADGALTGSSAPQAAQGDDAYVDGDSFNVSIASTSGGNYEALDTSSTATITINDTIDTTTVLIEDVAVDEGESAATVQATVDNAPQDSPLVVTLSNGATITFAVGETTATSTSFAVGGEGQTVVTMDSASGGNYENLDISDTATVTVENVPPTSDNATILTDEDTAYQFDGSEFAFSDTGGDTLDSVTITSLPTAGTLLLNGVAVNADDSISVADLASLTFEPAQDEAGEGYASFNFTVSDGDADSSEYTITIDVDPVADAASVTSVQVSTNGFAYTIATSKTTGDSQLIRIDMDNGSQTLIGNISVGNKDTVDIEALAADPSDENTLYAFVNTGGARTLLKIDVELLESGAPGAIENLSNFTNTTGEMGSTFVNGVMYVFTKDGTNSKLYSVDTDDGTPTEIGTLASENIVAMTFDVSKSTFYAINTNGEVLEIHGILEGGPITSTALLDGSNNPVTVNGAVESLAYSQNGKLFAIDRVTGTVFEIDTDDGMVTNLLTLDVSDYQGDGIESLAITTSGNTVVNDGEQFGISLAGHFGDFTDGSEQHYFLVSIPDETWLVGGTDTTVVTDPDGVPSGTYAMVPVDDLMDADGNAFATLILKSPVDNTESVSVESFNIYAVSQETGGIIDTSDDLYVSSPETVEIQVLYGDSVFRGSEGDESITGTTGDDLIYGAGGDDILTGDTGSDLFVWLAGDETGSPTDTVTDFNVGQGDVLDFSDLLQGEGPDADGSDLDSYLSFSYNNGTGDTTIEIDVDGDGGGADMTVIVENVDLVGAAANNIEVIDNLIQSGNLTTD
ncbi:type I secretion C-terminal target domain-containing protein [Porticoccaceae bacterium LTM1]|nr:type I secretion C-terminal target domain-containing protein [Porticoccaceae bacterium LTM1]